LSLKKFTVFVCKAADAVAKEFAFLNVYLVKTIFSKVIVKKLMTNIKTFKIFWCSF